MSKLKSHTSGSDWLDDTLPYLFDENYVPKQLPPIGLDTDWLDDGLVHPDEE